MAVGKSLEWTVVPVLVEEAAATMAIGEVLTPTDELNLLVEVVIVEPLVLTMVREDTASCIFLSKVAVASSQAQTMRLFSLYRQVLAELTTKLMGPRLVD